MMWMCVQVIAILGAHLLGLMFSMAAGATTTEESPTPGRAAMLFFLACVFHCIGSVVAMGLEVGP